MHVGFAEDILWCRVLLIHTESATFKCVLSRVQLSVVMMLNPKLVFIQWMLASQFTSVLSANTPETTNKPDKTILIFGGNGMIGAPTTERLLLLNYTLVLINRGNWYWDTAETIEPFVKHIKCDRMQSLQRCAGLQHYIWSMDAPAFFDAVVDFSAYHSFEITEALTMLRGKVRKYIYISSDSVYEVCNKTHSKPSREEDAVRPETLEYQELFRQNDNYGDRKLSCEEELLKHVDTEWGIPFISLRLPDVIGPRDNTYRWWIYQLWIILADYVDKPLSVPRNLWDQPMSFVYADDVAEVIGDVICSGSEFDNQAYNLALDENPTLPQFLHALMDVLNIEDVEIVKDEEVDGFHLFPSVKLGPIDTTKAKRLLNWNPTSWIDALDVTVAFYEKAMRNKQFEGHRNDVIRTLQQHFTKDPSNIVKGLYKKYGVILTATHDEL